VHRAYARVKKLVDNNWQITSRFVIIKLINHKYKNVDWGFIFVGDYIVFSKIYKKKLKWVFTLLFLLLPPPIKMTNIF
jgi:hypothetical protein